MPLALTNYKSGVIMNEEELINGIALRRELKQKRLQAGLSQPKAAKIVGRSLRAYQYWECTGTNNTKIDMFRVAVLLSYLDQLINGHNK